MTPLTQAVPCNGDAPLKEGVPLQEELVQAVHLRGHRVNDGLAIGGAVVEENIQDGVVDEVTQAVDARQSDSLQVTAGGKEGRGDCSWRGPWTPPREFGGRIATI